ncbi:MAG: hypothetical protein CME88_17665 [Hirschia sp.]|nr:hypothetical protein [Hirschia sp.]MBF19065.1 hypothetical protein [Hirschia sp.]MBF20199.1 hypothetical protein [Hirschia sp.]
MREQGVCRDVNLPVESSIRQLQKRGACVLGAKSSAIGRIRGMCDILVKSHIDRLRFGFHQSRKVLSASDAAALFWGVSSLLTGPRFRARPFFYCE